MDDLAAQLTKVKQQITDADELPLLEQLRVDCLGKKGSLTAVLKNLSNLPERERAKVGQTVNRAKAEIILLIQQRTQALQQQKLQQRLLQEAVDVTLPGRGQNVGSLHPVTKTRERIEQIFSAMGFGVVEGPEVEDEFHNFTALNMPQHHPARAAHDTFYFDNNLLLRTHTSPVQIRALENAVLPLRVITPGRVYRCDSDVTHTPMFHQMEGFLVDKHATFSNLKYILNNFLEAFFEERVEVRFRPSFFPFTEPSAEVDLQCMICRGKGCRVCKGSGWIEVLGCGMVHPKVLQAVNIDSEIYTGFAFGLGIDRFAMYRYRIDDLRMLFENDLRFLEQF